MQVVFADSALDDLEAIRRYGQQFNPAASTRLFERLVAAALSLATFPQRGRKRADGRRELVVAHPYIIIYGVEPNRVRILRIWHTARNPSDLTG